jgi:tetratricopeptide (TPR) repeat protein
VPDDLYTIWLRVPAGPRPPDPHALLGLPAFCTDLRQINDAADLQLERLDRRALHPDPKLRDACQRLMNEVAKARNVLVSKVQRPRHDATPQPRQLPPKLPSAGEIDAPFRPTEFPAKSQDTSEIRRRKSEGKNAPQVGRQPWNRALLLRLTLIVSVGLAMVLRAWSCMFVPPMDQKERQNWWSSAPSLRTPIAKAPIGMGEAIPAITPTVGPTSTRSSSTPASLPSTDHIDGAGEQRDEAHQQQGAKNQEAIAQAVSKFLTDPRAIADPDKLLGDKVTVVEVITAAVQRLDAGQLADKPMLDAAVRETAGTTLASLARYVDAEANLRKALNLRRIALSADHPDVAQSLNDLGHVLYTEGKFADAEPLYLEALSIRRKALAPNDPAIAESLVNLADVLVDRNELAEAEAFYREALAIQRKAYPPVNAAAATTIDHLLPPLVMEGKDHQTDLIPLYREQLRIRKATLSPDDPAIAVSLYNLAAQVLTQREASSAGSAVPDEAQALYEEAVDIWRKALASGRLCRPEDIASLAYFAWPNQTPDDRSFIEPLVRQAVAASQRILPPGHPDIAMNLRTLAAVLRNEPPESESLLRESLDIQQKSLGPEHPACIQTLQQLAWLMRRQHRLTEAEAFALEALRIANKAYPPDHPRIARLLFGLAQIDYALKKVPEAQSAVERMLDIDSKASGPTSSRANIDAQAYAELLEREGKHAEAKAVGEKYNLKYVGSMFFAETPAAPSTHSAVVAAPARSFLTVDEATDKLQSDATQAWLAGRLAEAEATMQKVLDNERKRLPPGAQAIGFSEELLGRVLVQDKKYAEAEKLYIELAAMDSGAYAFDTEGGRLRRSQALASLAECMVGEHRFPEAESLLRQAVNIYQKMQSPPVELIAIELESLAGVLTGEGKVAEADSIYNQAIDQLRAGLPGIRSTLPKDDPQVVGALDVLARLLVHQNMFADAEDTYREALAMLRRTKPPGDVTIAIEVQWLADDLKKEHKLAELEQLRREELSTLSQALGPENEATRNAAVSLELALQENGHNDEAKALQAKYSQK